MAEHDLKTLAPYWDAIERGDKLFEIRRDDRGFQKGDILNLHRMMEHKPAWFDTRLGERRTLRRRVRYVLTGGQFGLEPGYVAMAIEPA